MTDRARRTSSRPPDAQAHAMAARLLDDTSSLDCPAEQGATGVEGAAPSDGRSRRTRERFEVIWSVDCATEDTFLFATITNITEMGIFVRTIEPLAIGTELTLRFAPDRGGEPFVLRGTVVWVNELRPLHDNPNPGMGICFSDLMPADRERIVDVIHTIAYLRDVPSN